jgi:hypothetical protein
MLATAAAAWEDLQAQSCTGIMNNRNLKFFYTFKPSQMIKQSMVISKFAEILKKQGPTEHIQITY